MERVGRLTDALEQEPWRATHATSKHKFKCKYKLQVNISKANSLQLTSDALEQERAMRRKEAADYEKELDLCDVNL